MGEAQVHERPIMTLMLFSASLVWLGGRAAARLEFGRAADGV